MNVEINDWKEFRDLCMAFEAPCATIYWDSDEYFMSLWEVYKDAKCNIYEIQDMINNAWQYQVFGDIEDLIDNSVFNEWNSKEEFMLWCCVTFPEVENYCNQEYHKLIDKNDILIFNDILDDSMFETIVNSFDSLDFVTPLQELCDKYRYTYVFNDIDNILIIK